MAKFMRIENGFVVRYEEQGVLGQGLTLLVTSQGISFTGESTAITTLNELNDFAIKVDRDIEARGRAMVGNLILKSHRDLSEFCKALVSAWKDHLVLKVRRTGDLDAAVRSGDHTPTDPSRFGETTDGSS
jgi:hypothetical protein